MEYAQLNCRNFIQGFDMSCSCGTNSDIPNDVVDRVNNHPCYSEGAHHHYARIHLAVAPACNIQCNYCNRKFDCSNESRPGVTSEKLKPLDALKKVLSVGSEIKQLSVVGIAGPGDALANPKQTLETFRLLKEHTPDLKLCISTNGLELEKYVDELYDLGVDHITVTINTLSPETGAKIYPWVYDRDRKRKLRGLEGAKFLLENQLRGVKKALSKGILIKANSVLIPNINERDLVELSKELKKMGVFLHNIMPLLSKPEFGTKFGFDGVKSATDRELEEVQKECGVDMNLMKHCRQCRADAVGLIGEDRSEEFTKERFKDVEVATLKSQYNIRAREDFHQKIEEFRGYLAKANEVAKDSLGDRVIKVGVTSSADGVINEHFGSAKEFLIYEAGESGVNFLGSRAIENPYCSGAENCTGDNPIDEIKSRLEDVDLLLTVKIGDCPKDELNSINLKTDDSFAYQPIEASILKATKKFLAQDSEVN